MPERYGINVDLLVDLGLTQNQAKVYLSAAKIGPASISDLADHSGVRREEIYRLLPDLEKAGLIEKMMGKPMRIRTPDVESAMSTLISHERRKAQARIEEFVEKTNQIEDYLSKTGLAMDTDSSEQDDFALLSKKESVRSRLHEMIQDAKKSIDVFYSRSNLIWFLSTQSQLLKNSVKDGIQIRLLSNPTDGKDRIPKILERRFPSKADIELKYMTGKFVDYVIVDGKSALLVTSTSHQPHAHNLFTKNPSLVMLMQQTFDENWHRSAHWKTVEGISIIERPPESSQAEGPNSILLCKDHKSKLRVVSNFIKERLENDCFVFYSYSETSDAEIRKALDATGLVSSDYEKKNLLQFMESHEHLGDKESYSIDRLVDAWDKMYFQADERDLDIVLIFDMQHFFDEQMVERIVEFERNLDTHLDSHMRALCIYCKDTILATEDPLGLYSNIVVLHDKVLTDE